MKNKPEKAFEGYYSFAELCELLSWLKRSTINHYASRNLFPFATYHADKRRLFKVEDVDEYVRRKSEIVKA